MAQSKEPIIWGAARWPLFWQRALKYAVIMMGAISIAGLGLVLATIIWRLL